jgi:hypothetical protein
VDHGEAQVRVTLHNTLTGIDMLLESTLAPGWSMLAPGMTEHDLNDVLAVLTFRARGQLDSRCGDEHGEHTCGLFQRHPRPRDGDLGQFDVAIGSAHRHECRACTEQW